MRTSWLALGTICIVILAILPLSACGCVSESEYSELESEYASLEPEHKLLESAYESLKEEHTNLQSQYKSLENNYSSLQFDHEGLAQCLAEAKDERNALQDKLGVLESKYPPRLFKDASELESWLAEQPNPPKARDAVILFKHARDLQKVAAEDGYIISASINGPDEEGCYYVWCSAVLADHSYYEWDPDTDELYFVMDVRYF